MSLTNTDAPVSQPTGAQARALKWLKDRGGDGMFDNDGVLLAMGELAPFMRSTWNALRDLGLVEFYAPSAIKRRGRVRVTK
jgi:hypothetical protein